MSLSQSRHSRNSNTWAQPVADKTILAVDDDAVGLLLTEQFFTSEGYRVATALSGEDALDRLETVMPDIILLDIMMPGMDGYEVCQHIRRMPRFRDTPVIVLTALDNAEAEQRAFDIGAWDFVGKPIVWSTLKYRVRYALRASAAIAAEKSANRLTRAINKSPTEVLIFDSANLKILDENVSALKNLGYSKEEIESLTFTEVIHNGSENYLSGMLERVRESRQEKFNIQLQRKNGSTYPTEGTILFSTEEEPQVYIAILQDNSEKKRIEQELHQLSFYDELTGLANRRLLENHAAHLLSIAERKGHKCAICMLDLDGFKQINDSLGPSIGDFLLQDVSDRLAEAIRDFDLVARDNSISLNNAGMQLARFGGDEFILLLSDFSGPLDPAKVALRILQSVARPYRVQNHQLSLTASLGIALYPDDGQSLEQLIHHAHSALYNAKKMGKNRYSFYTEEINQSLTGRLRLESELHQALERGEFELHFQPQVDSSLQRISGAESLLRWRHPDGMRMPDAFITVAEETGLILDIGKWVLAEAIAQLNRWKGVMPEDFRLSVNLSALQLREPSFLEYTRQLLRANPGVGNRLIFELTESALLGDEGEILRWLREAESLGIRLAIDDFGTGYSSLNYLVQLPVYYIKVDRAFVTNIHENEDHAAIVTAIFQMAQALRMQVVVEGVETAEQLEALKRIGEFDLQGWLVSKALPLAEFEAFFKRFHEKA